MAEAKETPSKGKLTLKRPKKLELKKTTEAGKVSQSFSHGRTREVKVERKTTVTYKRGKGGSMSEVKEAEGKAGAEAATLSEAERQARQRALQGATAKDQEPSPAEVEAAKEEAEAVFGKAEAEAPEAEAEERAATEEAEAEAAGETAEAAPETEEPQTDEAAARRAEADEMARKLAEEQARAAMQLTPSSKVAPKSTVPERAPEEEERPRKKEAKRPAPAKTKGEPKRREGKLTITRALEQGDGGGERTRSLASVRRARERQKQREAQQAGPKEHKKQSREVVVPETITVQELANRMAERGADVVKILMKLGVMVTINQTIDADTAELVVEEFGHKIKRVAESDVEMGIEGKPDDPSKLAPRPPVVTVMGHVDHGKTSLLDALRATDVVAGEAGGITQHIGAYQVQLSGGQRITFLDTPGHAAFTEMRSRGATVTDLVILVVAADDSVQPQTIEAISHAKAAEVPIIVAVNKIDAKGANPDKVKQDLLQHEIVVESMGGDTQCIEVSAKEKTGLDTLEEAILLQAELLELKANPDREAQGAIVEAKLEAGRGPVATVLVQRGTLKVGDVFIAGAEWGRVRAMLNDRGENVETAGPAQPVEVLGLNGAPNAGDEFVVVDNEQRAREISEYRQAKIKEEQVAVRGSVDQLFSKIQTGEAAELDVVVKADVQGSVEAIIKMLEDMSTDEVAVRVLHSGVGGINESDVTLAKASDGMIIAFNVRANAQARDAAKRDGVEIRYYSVIYNISDDVRALLSGMLSPTRKENFLGYAEVLEVFKVSKVGNVAGCKVTEGLVKRGAGVRLLRDDVVIHEGELATLKRFKDDVNEVRAGTECGMSFANYNDIKVGDVIECFEVEEVQREL